MLSDGQEHQERFQQLREFLDELLAYFIYETGKRPSQVTALELIQWVYAKSHPK